MTKATMIHPDGSTADVELHTIPADVDRLLGADVPHRFLEVQKKGILQRLFGG